MNKKQLIQMAAVLIVIIGAYLVAHEAKAPEQSNSATSTLGNLSPR